MNRVCLTKDGKLIEMQSGGESENKELEIMRLDTLKQNALNAGYKEKEIEVKWVTDEEWSAIQEANKPILDPNIAIKTKLTEIDLKSIRALREWVAIQHDAPKFLTDLELEAITERKKLK